MHFRSTLLSLALAAMLATGLATAADKPLLRERSDADRPALMLIGSSHFANYNLDVNNTNVPDVMSSRRQAEIAKVVQALATFKPTKIAVEVSSGKQEKLSANYRAFLAGTYKLRSDESEQLGMRLAAAAGHSDIYAVDWNEMPPGKIEDFDYGEWAEKHGQGALLARIRKNAEVAEDNKRLNDTTVAEWLLKYNEPESLASKHRRYFDYALLGDNESQPGANWIANWYGRNLKIFTKLVALASQPGDRVLVVYGSGHIFPLREFALQSGAFTVVDPLPLLRQAR